MVRCMALAHALTEIGTACVFASRRTLVSGAPIFASAGFPVIELDCPETEESAWLRDALPDGCDLLVIDHYRRDHRFESACRGWAARILVVDDLADRVHDCDILLDQTLGRESSDYTGLVPERCQLLLGASHALLRPEFPRLRSLALARRGRGNSVHRVLISFGYMDGQGLCIEALSALAQAGFRGRADVMLGSISPRLEQLLDFIRIVPFEVQVFTDADNVAALMVEADLALGAGGSTSWERCCLGLPTVIVVTADNQSLIARKLEQIGAALLIEPQGDSLARAVEHLLHDAEARGRMAGAAQAVCDGRGTDRCRLGLAEKTYSLGGEVNLRLADSKDTEYIYRLQRIPQVRRYFRNPAAPTWEEHVAWSERVLSDPGVLLHMVECEGRAVGMLRLDSATDEQWREISIAIHPDEQGRGLGKAALHFVRCAYPAWHLCAEVYSENIASRRIFLAAGFTPCGPDQLISRGMRTGTPVVNIDAN